MEMIKSPLRYPGGKSKAVKFLSQFVPNFKEFREPMCGGASMTLFFAQIKPRAKYIISDINYDLYCFWKTLKESPERLIREIYAIKTSFLAGRELFKKLIERRHELKDCFQRAVDFYVLNRITFSGTVDCGGYSEQAYKQRFTINSIKRLAKVSKLLQRVEVLWGDYERFLKEDGQDVFIFLDPPYYTARASRLYGKRGNLHINFDHERLARLVRECKHRIMITYDASEYIKGLYKGFYIIEWRFKYGMTNYGRDHLREGNELLITNYPMDSFLVALKKQPDILEKIVDYYPP